MVKPNIYKQEFITDGSLLDKRKTKRNLYQKIKTVVCNFLRKVGLGC